MGLVYHNGKFIPEEHIQKAAEDELVLRLLRKFLDANEPGLVKFLVHTWRTQGNAITYKELREAILRGDINYEWLEDWMQDYSLFVKEHMQPAWEKAINEAVKELERKYPTFFFDPMADGVRSWVESRAASFVTEVTQTQIEGIRAVVQRAAALEDLTVSELARVIRPMVGLTYQQSLANMNYYETLIKSGMSKQKALDKSIRYGAKQHRYRGFNIARTELAFAYNQGAHEGTKQAQAAGLIGECVKIWCTADDERVCSICNSLEGTAWGMDDDILYEYKYKRSGITSVRRINPKLSGPTVGKRPPAHPGCRCAVKYKEISPPTLQNNN